MKLEFDDLRLIEAKMLIDALALMRAGQPFNWSPAGAQPQLVKDENKKET